jgi:hypothetical protein
MRPNDIRIASFASLLFMVLGLAFAQNASSPSNATTPVDATQLTPLVENDAPITDATGVVELRFETLEADSFSLGETLTDLAAADGRGHGRSCGHGIKACDASQVGQPCDPDNLNVLCSRQSNGHYCCLAYAP